MPPCLTVSYRYSPFSVRERHCVLQVAHVPDHCRADCRSGDVDVASLTELVGDTSMHGQQACFRGALKSVASARKKNRDQPDILT